MQTGEDGGSPQDHEHSNPVPSDSMLNGGALSGSRHGRLRNTDLASASANRVTSRSPHPYHRRGSVLDHPSRVKPDIASRSRQVPSAQGNYEVYHRSRGSRQHTRGSPNESGTEADDESISYLRALPAPPLRQRKGLKIAMPTGLDGQETPLLTPTAIDEQGKQFDFPTVKSKKTGQERVDADEALRIARAKFVKRRRAELGRRVCEVLLLASIGMLVLGNGLIRSSIQDWQRAELLSHITIISALYFLYPIRLIAYSWKRSKPWNPIQRTIRLPAAFDPAPILYPQFIPVLIALILLPSYPKVLLPNLVLGLASVPGGLFRFGNWDIEPLRWLASIAPLIASEHTDFPHKIFATKPYALKTEPWERLEREVIVALYPLHQSLVGFLQYLTTTSLLPAEVHLMSIGLINLLLCAEAPPTIILSTLLWVGGLSAYILIGPVIRWNIALARVPRWRFQRVGRLVQMRQSFLGALNSAMLRSKSVSPGRIVGESDADDDLEGDDAKRSGSIISLGAIKTELLQPIRTKLFSAGEHHGLHETRSAVQPGAQSEFDAIRSNGALPEPASRPRSTTLPSLGATPRIITPQLTERKRRAITYGKTIFGRSFSSLSHSEATIRKWAYALYTYATMLLLILGPLRNMIGKYALNGHEPFGWAISYLFGNIQQIRFAIWHWNLEWWIPLPNLPHTHSICTLGTVEHYRSHVFQEANTRLLICGWCIAIITVGLGVVLSFTFVEVDTRRKVFHFMMVAMLLPTIFVDPAFVSLALVLILAVFLILDLLRASQLPPLSKPIAAFLTPYVDGRDLRGPVVVSHIFLLIGCAVPLWLSLAGSTFSGPEPWKNWEVDKRDISMVSGVICVGMGDAAASLIGRRYGRRKWPWTGGKSLEGSAAFAVAVTVGLVAAKVWLRVGGWDDSTRTFQRWIDGAGGARVEWGQTVVKASVAACGASFMEAVLTGGNDNVVVPVGLWILVRALDI